MQGKSVPNTSPTWENSLEFCRSIIRPKLKSSSMPNSVCVHWRIGPAFTQWLGTAWPWLPTHLTPCWLLQGAASQSVPSGLGISVSFLALPLLRVFLPCSSPNGRDSNVPRGGGGQSTAGSHPGMSGAPPAFVCSDSKRSELSFAQVA